MCIEHRSNEAPSFRVCSVCLESEKLKDIPKIELINLLYDQDLVRRMFKNCLPPDGVCVQPEHQDATNALAPSQLRSRERNLVAFPERQLCVVMWSAVPQVGDGWKHNITLLRHIAAMDMSI